MILRIVIVISIFLNLFLGTVVYMNIKEKIDISDSERSQYQNAVYFLNAAHLELSQQATTRSNRITHLSEGDRHLLVSQENFKSISLLLGKKHLNNSRLLSQLTDTELIVHDQLSKVISNQDPNTEVDQKIKQLVDHLQKLAKVMPTQDFPTDQQVDAINQIIDSTLSGS